MNRFKPSRAPEIVVRSATAADAAAISALLRDAFLLFEPLYTPAAFASTVLDEAGILARLHQGPLWVGESRSSIIGTVGAVRIADVVTIRGMAVHPLARGCGVGRALLDCVEGFAAHERVRLLELYTTAFLDQAIRLYLAAGFAFSSETINPHGTELLRMTKTLNG